MSKKNIEIKGITEGLLVTISTEDWQEGEKILFSEMEAQNEFLSGAHIILDVHTQVLNAVATGKLIDKLSDFDVKLIGIISDSYQTERSAMSYGLRTSIEKKRFSGSTSYSLKNNNNNRNTLFLRQTIRSGVLIESTGDVAILGDINPGATIIARGDIMIWGKLRGMVHAGCEGNQNAVICALDFDTEQARISGFLISLPKRKKKKTPEIALIKNEKIILQTWDSK